MLAALGHKTYNFATAVALIEALRHKAVALSRKAGRQWTGKEVEMALFAEAAGGRAAAGGGGGKKRKR